jgi:hypothetical protein
MLGESRAGRGKRFNSRFILTNVPLAYFSAVLGDFRLFFALFSPPAKQSKDEIIEKISWRHAS